MQMTHQNCSFCRGRIFISQAFALSSQVEVRPSAAGRLITNITNNNNNDDDDNNNNNNNFINIIIGQRVGGGHSQSGANIATHKLILKSANYFINEHH